MVRIATFNLENLFVRPTAMKMEYDSGRSAIEDHAIGNSIIKKKHILNLIKLNSSSYAKNISGII
jgi:hypothetical protein